MTTEDLPLMVFATCNVLRIAAYVPQMLKLARHPAAAASFSFCTWALFAAANLSTAVYSGMVLGDTALGIVNAFSALCCATLICIAAWRCQSSLIAPGRALD